MDVKIEIQGLKGVEDALSQAGPKLAKRALRKALKSGGEVLVAAAKSRAPVLAKGTPQRKPGELRDSITMTAPRLSPKEESGRVRVGPEYKKADRSQSPGVYGSFVEFGSVHGPAQPYMRPGFDSANKASLEAFTKEIREGVDSLKK